MARHYKDKQVVLSSQCPLGQIVPDIRLFWGFPFQYLEAQHFKLMEEKM